MKQYMIYLKHLLKAHLLLTGVLISGLNGYCYGADTTAREPTAVLVMLRAEKNRIEALKRARLYSKVEEVEEDAEGERLSMAKDFKRNYKALPVYFFVDTNIDKILKRQFVGALADTDGNLIQDSTLLQKAGFVIAYYGYVSERFKVTDSVRRTHDVEPPYGRGLVICNEKMHVLTYFYKLGYHSLLFHSYRKNKDLVYVSKHFDIEYYPFAKYFNMYFDDNPKSQQNMLDFLKIYDMYKD